MQWRASRDYRIAGLPPLLILFLIAVLALLAGLIWFGVQWGRQGVELAAQRQAREREAVLDAGVAALSNALAQLESTTDPESLSLPGDSVAVFARGGEWRAHPAARLAFLPEATAPVRSKVFDEVERLEWAGRLKESHAALQNIGPAEKAGTLLRRARILRRLEDSQGALQAYRELAQLGTASVEGLPAEAVAVQASMGILEKLGMTAEAERKARELANGLERRRWPLDEAAFGFYLDEISRRLPDWKPSAGLQNGVQMALALKAAWGSDRRKLVREGGVRYLFLRAGPAHILLGPKWIAQSWSPPGGFRLEARAPDESGDGATASIRYAAETRLPWNLRAISLDPASERREAELRNRILWIFLLMVTLLVSGVSIWMVRSVTRELTVSRLQSDFVAAVSHEFRTPLTSLCQISELLTQGRVTGEVDRGIYYGIMARESLRLRRLVEGLLDFGRMEAGAREYRFERLNLADFAQSVAAEFSAEHEAFRERLELDCSAETGTVLADRTALECVIWNLLDNARKYAGETASVRLSTRRDAGQAWILVEDQGIGIPIAEQGRIFEKFVRGKAARDSNLRGSGIGLAMVKRIVEAHNGKVELKSREGRGCSFRIQLAGERNGEDSVSGR